MPRSATPAHSPSRTWRLGEASVGATGVVAAIQLAADDDDDLERLLLEIGFVEGAQVSLLHEGPFGRDPIAVRVDDMRVALRRHEALAVLIRSEP